MALGFLYGAGGESKKRNPILFENGNFGDGYGIANIAWSSSVSGINPTHTIDANGIHFNGQNGNGCDCVYVTGIDLSEYEGKNLYFSYKVSGGAELTKAFAITSLAKKPLMGVATPYGSGWENHYGMGFSNLAVPTYCKSDSTFWDVNQGTSSVTNPFLTVTKIWIAD